VIDRILATPNKIRDFRSICIASERTSRDTRLLGILYDYAKSIVRNILAACVRTASSQQGRGAPQ